MKYDSHENFQLPTSDNKENVKEPNSFSPANQNIELAKRIYLVLIFHSFFQLMFFGIQIRFMEGFLDSRDGIFIFVTCIIVVLAFLVIGGFNKLKNVHFGLIFSLNMLFTICSSFLYSYISIKTEHEIFKTLLSMTFSMIVVLLIFNLISLSYDYVKGIIVVVIFSFLYFTFIFLIASHQLRILIPCTFINILYGIYLVGDIFLITCHGRHQLNEKNYMFSLLLVTFDPIYYTLHILNPKNQKAEYSEFNK